MAYEIIEPSLHCKSLAILIYMELFDLLSIQTKDPRPLKSRLRQFRLEGRVHIQQRYRSRVQADLTYMKSLIAYEIELDDDERHSPPPSVNPATPTPSTRPPTTLSPVGSSVSYT
jgi:hypothetical protein